MKKEMLGDKSRNIISFFAIGVFAVALFFFLFFSTNLFNTDLENQANIRKIEKKLSELEIPEIPESEFVQEDYNLEIPSIPSIDNYELVAHEIYSAFSEAYFEFNNNEIILNDDLIYEKGYYSVNGGDWVEFTLQGNRYASYPFLLGLGTGDYPSALDQEGTHFVILFSCSLVNNAWDCHGDGDISAKWQLEIIENSNSNPVCSDGLCNGGETCNSCPEDCGSCSSSGDECPCGNGYYCSTEKYPLSPPKCLLEVPGNTYFVSLDGSDNNPGTFENPWGTWYKAGEELQPGDIVYIRGGVWRPSSRGGHISPGIVVRPRDGLGSSGTPGNPIRYFNYPGESPILDASLIGPASYGWNFAINMNAVQYIHLKGLTVSNVFTTPGTQAYGIGCNACANMIYENLVVHDINGRAFQHWSGAYVPGGPPVPFADDTPFTSDTTYWINCDAYNLFTPHEGSPGNSADGWKVETVYGGHYYWEGCRAWNYADDGFDPHGVGYRHFKNCWAMSTDKYEGLSDAWDIEGNGFKVAAMLVDYVPGYVPGEEQYVSFENCIAADCVGVGFYNNILNNYGEYMPNGGVLYNNFAYNNRDLGYSDASWTIHRNNIDYKSGGLDIGLQNGIESHNTWIATNNGGYPGWYTNPAYTVTDSDFVSLDTSQLTAPRKPDGSLPDINFGKLAPGSDLINTGTNVGIPYYGSAPDLGAFESNY